MMKFFHIKKNEFYMTQTDRRKFLVGFAFFPKFWH